MWQQRNGGVMAAVAISWLSRSNVSYSGSAAVNAAGGVAMAAASMAL